MGSPTLSAPVATAESGKDGCAENAPLDAQPRFDEDQADRFFAIRGAITGILLGTVLWGAIFAVVGMIRH